MKFKVTNKKDQVLQHVHLFSVESITSKKTLTEKQVAV